MEFTSVLAGLPEAVGLYGAMRNLRYLLLLLFLDGITGLYGSQIVRSTEVMTLPRQGYRAWYHRAMLRSSGLLLFTVAVIALILCAVSADSFLCIWIAAGFLLLNLLVLTGIQLLLMLLLKKPLPGYCIITLIQVLSIYASGIFPKSLRLALPGNWGMVLRSSLAAPDGWQIPIVIVLEILLLILLWMGGWRIIRKDRGMRTWI